MGQAVLLTQVNLDDVLPNSWQLDSWQLDDLNGRLLVTGILVVLLLGVRWILSGVLKRRVEDVETRHRARKTVTYVVSVLLIAGLATTWIEPLRGLAAFFGLVSAGIAIALSDLLKNFAGWAFILSRRPFRPGDRIVVQEHMGDVIDIRLFSFTLLEVGAYVDAMQSTGRIIHMPNGVVLTEPIVNSSAGFAFAWHEIPVLITFESDWRRGEQHLQEILEAECADTLEEAERQIASAVDDLPVRYRSLTPTVYLSVRDSGVLLTGRFLVPVRQRRGREMNVWRAMLDRIHDDPTVELAYPTLRAVASAGPVSVGHHAAPPPVAEPMPDATEDIEIVTPEPEESAD